MVPEQDMGTVGTADLAPVGRGAARFALDLIAAGGPISPQIITADAVRAALDHAGDDTEREAAALRAYCDGLIGLSRSVITEIIRVTGNAGAGGHVTGLLEARVREGFDQGAAVTLLSSGMAAVRTMRWAIDGSGDRPVVRVEQPILALGLFHHCGIALSLLSQATGRTFDDLAPRLRELIGPAPAQAG